MKTLVKTFLLLLLPFFATAQNAECIKHLEKVKAELANSKADTNRVLLLTELCLGYLWYNSDSLEFYSKQGLELAKQLQFYKGDARILNCQGIFLAFHGNSPEALALLYKALRIAEESKLTFETANCLSSIGVSYWFLNDFTKSHDFINRAIKLDETVQHTPKDIYWRILIQVWSGIDNIRLNKLDSANIILKKAYDNAFNPEFTDLYSIRPTILMFSGEVQSKLGNKESAFSYLHQSIAYFIKNKDAIGAADACNNIAKVFKDVNQRDSVIYYSKLGLEAGLKFDYKPAIFRSSKMLAEQYETTDTKQANYYWKIVLAMNDSLYGAPKIQELQKTLFEEQRRQQLAQELQTKRENQLKQYGFGAGLGVLCLIGLFLYRNNRQKQKANTKLQNTLGELQKAQTELENKNIEAQIELSLEKVRSRSMAMHQSNELASAASVLFQQIKDLGFEMWSCGFCIWKPDDFSELWMSADSGGLLPPMMMPYKEEPTHHKIYEDSLLGLPTHEYIWEGEELLKHYEFLYTIPSVKEAIDILKKSGLSLPLRQCYYVGYFKQGYLLIITKEPNTEMNNLSYRFTKVFEQTYTRFLDLQKVEAQAREAEIELALERVRARTMAMQHSDELAETSFLLDIQVRALGIKTRGCGFNIYGENESTEWFSSELGTMPTYKTPRENFFLRYFEEGQKGKQMYIESFEGDACAAHYDYLCTLPDAGDSLKKFKENGGSFPTQQTDHVAYFKYGYLLFITLEPEPDAHDIFIRFAKVFEQTYTRFLDLQKAEAQARESQIQLALERVRARTMAMQHSTELNDTAALLFQQIKSLGIPPWSCGFNIWEQGDAVFNSYMAAPEGTILAENKIPLTEEATFIHFQESRDRGDELFVDVLEGEIIETHYNYFQTLPGIREMFEKRAAAGFPLPTFQINHLANFSHGNLMFITYEPCPEAHDIFIRFGKVFEQTYTRFLDLQKAEAQAREAQIEVALERVRSKTIAMHNSADVGESVAALFDELVKLGVKTNRCGILIHTDSEFSEVWTARSKTNEKATLVIGRLEINMHPMLVGIRTSWLNKESFYSYKLTGQDMINYYQAINNSKYYPTQFNLEALPAKEIHSDFHFSEGSVFAFTNEPLPTEWINVFKRFTSVFGQTYRRYLDLQKAEAQAREAQIEVALERVRSRAMAMQTSEELSIVIGSVYAELTKLDIELNRCFFMLFDPKTLEVTWWMASHEVGANSRGYKLPYHEHAPQLAHIKGWKERQEKWRYVAGGDEKKDWDEYIFAETELSQLPEFIISNMKSVKTINLSASFYNFGCLTTGTLEPLGEESFEILVRFAKVFDSTYTRFLDLQKAEAQAEQAKFDLIQIQTEKAKAEEALKILKATQNQLIQSEKLAGLGELTAGIAHEIQNPLNFVNNFAELSVDLAKDINSEIRKPEMDKEYLEELLTDLTHNQEKINLHGKRASSIVKGMLEHSRASTGVKELTDINKLCDEYFRLAYHGLRAKDKDFNCELISKFDEALPKIEIIPQDVGRVVLNLINNAFYAVNERANQKRSGNFESSPNVENLRGYKPVVTVTTQKTDNGIEIRVKDNGTGMPESVKEKIFQPFFTTKPTGSGTGLGLSLAYDIVTKGHSGTLKVESVEGEGSEFVISLPQTK